MNRAVAVLWLLSALLAAAALTVALQPDGELDVRVLEMRDPFDMDRVTSLTVEASNPTGQAVTPRFSVPANALMNRYTWTIREGPDRIAPGGTATYELTQPPYTAIPRGSGFRVLANDIDDPAVSGGSSVRRALPRGDRPAVPNPAFRAWAPSMFHPGDLPFAWDAEERLLEGDEATIGGGPGNLTLTLDPAPRPSEADAQASLVALHRRVDFPAEIRVRVEEATRGAHAPDPRTMVGVTLEDVYGRRQLAILFVRPGPGPTGPIPLDAEDLESRRILVTGRTAEVDVEQVWRDAGWPLPTTRYAVQRTTAPSSVGFGASSPTRDKLQLMRPIELKVQVASVPPHEHDRLQARFAFVGGPALD